jgi:hypothetical protein
VVDLDERHKVGVFAVIILHQDAVILQADYGDPVAEVLREGCDGEAERGAWAQLLPWRWRLAPVNRVDGPLECRGLSMPQISQGKDTYMELRIEATWFGS